MSTAADMNAFTGTVTSAGAQRIVLGTRASIADQIDALPPVFAPADVVVDLADIETINSSDLSALIRFSLQVRRKGKAFTVSHVGPRLRQIFEITRFDRYCSAAETNGEGE